MAKSKYNSIRVNESAKSQIKMLSSRVGKTEYDYANRMIKFIGETGIDIFSESLPSVPDLIKNLDNRIVSFLKKREKDFFIPMDKSFKKLIELHSRTFESLETLDVINYSTEPKKLVVPKEEKSTLKIPENIGEENEEHRPLITPENSVQNTPQNEVSLLEEKEALLDKLERAEKEKKIYEKELKYLLANIVPSKSISGPKFVCNLSNKEMDRIKLLVSDS